MFLASDSTDTVVVRGIMRARTRREQATVVSLSRERAFSCICGRRRYHPKKPNNNERPQVIQGRVLMNCGRGAGSTAGIDDVKFPVNTTGELI